jgi:hypothetical protein
VASVRLKRVAEQVEFYSWPPTKSRTSSKSACDELATD